MMFEGDFALKKIEVLSGGEKSRVMMGKLLVAPANLLLMDEPTNHLDMESSDALLEALDAFDGAVVMVTHNEMFLHALAERLIIFYHDAIEVFEGGYQRFLDKGGWGDEEQALAVRKARPEKESGEKLDRKELRKRRAEIITERSRVLGPLEKGIEKAEQGIDAREKKIKELHAAMQEATLTKDGKRITAVSMEIHKNEQEIESLFEELEELTLKRDGLAPAFEERLREIDQA
jgi:ATP-binding cassette subfamily F protein 3